MTLKLSRRDADHEEFQEVLSSSAKLHTLTYFLPRHGFSRNPIFTLAQWDAEPTFYRSDDIAMSPDLLFNRLVLEPYGKLKYYEQLSAL